jgi:antitoxin HicB
MSKHIGSKFDDFLKEEELFDEAEAVSIKRLIAYQVQTTLGKKRLTKVALAKQMRTSRAEIDRILDPANTSITLKTILKLSRVLGRKLAVSFAR